VLLARRLWELRGARHPAVRRGFARPV